MTDWIEIAVDIHRERLEEAIEHLMAAGIPGWEEKEQEEHVTLTLWTVTEERGAIEAVLSPLGVSRVRATQDHSWLATWNPIQVGPFWIESIGAVAKTPPAHCHLIRLAHALAFGGGEHPTTQLCLQKLPGLINAQTRLLDVGCGSGILSIAAAKLGAQKIDALDIDPSAKSAFLKSTKASKVAGNFLEQWEQCESSYSLIVANILAPTLIDLAPQLMLRLAPSGWLMLAGIRKGADSLVRAAYPSLSVIDSETQDGWTCLLLQKK